MKKIIANYSIVDNPQASTDDDEKSIDNIIKIPVINPEEKVIITQQEEPPPPPPPPPEPKETILQLIRNNEGIVTGIEVQCMCGEKILIKMEY